MALCTKYPKYLEGGYKKNRLTVIELDEESKVDKNGKKVRQEAEIKYFGDFAPSVCRGSLCV